MFMGLYKPCGLKESHYPYKVCLHVYERFCHVAEYLEGFFVGDQPLVFLLGDDYPSEDFAGHCDSTLY